MNSKELLRQKLLIRRGKMTSQQVATRSKLICLNLIKLIDWSNIRSIHYFQAIKKLNEVDLSYFIHYLEKTYPDIKIYTTTQRNGKWVNVNGSSNYEVVLAPMLGFDKSLNRIGYGGGYYDKLLETMPNALKVGVCFNSGKIKRIPINEFDVPMNIIITEANTYNL